MTIFFSTSKLYLFTILNISVDLQKSAETLVNLEWSFQLQAKKDLKNDFEMKKPYISVNFWLCSSLTMSVRYQLMANNANRFNRGGIIIDNEETEGNGFGCQNSKNCCIFIFLVTVGFIMYLPFIPFSSNKRKFFNFDFGLICQLTSDFHSWTPAGNDLKMIWSFLLFYSSILISAKNFFMKQNVKLSKPRFLYFSVKLKCLFLF